MQKAFYLLLILAGLSSAVQAQRRSPFHNALYMEFGLGPGSSVGYKKGNLTGVSTNYAITYMDASGIYAGLHFQGNEYTPVPPVNNLNSNEQIEQWFLGLHGGKEIPIVSMLSADLGVGVSIMNTNVANLFLDTYYIFDKDGGEDDPDAFKDSYFNGTINASLLFRPHAKAPVYFKVGSYMNFNSYASTKGYLFTVGIRLAKY
ncbi:hypothetical protein [Solitalea lacus]|uniref:hypothetical protein n=1 Tax=Solitalea lacus TaxID=2911172 RepID=UPI001EDBB186|nr:hypothetical protein [Solitalea lacus]UKJ08964.1 hypothetical protein L2B55_07295 [Solitalea lacus]